MPLTTKQKADWSDQFTSEEWETVMERKQFPAVMDALTEGDLARATQLMRAALGACARPQVNVPLIAAADNELMAA